MTAATWKQAKKIVGCACAHADEMNCAIAQGLTTQFCGCRCHRYLAVATPAQKPAPEGQPCR